jgi:DNA-binding CsgD family transcriptional regulator
MPTTLARHEASPLALASRADLTAYLAALCADIQADHYMLLAVVHDRDRSDARVIASNWIYDAIQLIGFRQLAALAASDAAVSPGGRCRPVATEDGGSRSGIDAATSTLLKALGHAELYVLKLYAGRQRYYLLLSAAQAGVVGVETLAAIHMPVCYALSRAPDLLASAALVDPLTDRERECLFWVSEGKTTDDIAIILGVSANTANSYIANAIQKFGSSNRAMAMGTAIRSGVI